MSVLGFVAFRGDFNRDDPVSLGLVCPRCLNEGDSFFDGRDVFAKLIAAHSSFLVPKSLNSKDKFVCGGN